MMTNSNFKQCQNIAVPNVTKKTSTKTSSKRSSAKGKSSTINSGIVKWNRCINNIRYINTFKH